MTIAAAYFCEEGVILCADTQESIPGYTKTSANKLIAFPLTNMNLVFAGAGNNAVQIDEAVHEIAAAVDRATPQDGRSLITAIREGLDTVFPLGTYPRQGEPDVMLLMAVQTDTGLQLFKIADRNLAPVKKRATIGAGVILAEQLLERHYMKNCSLADAAIISIYTLHHVKRWVDGCGGNTDIALIPKLGRSFTFMPTAQVEKIEKYCDMYDTAVRGLLTATPRYPTDKSAFEAQLEIAKNGLFAARSSFQEWEDLMREVAEQIGVRYEDFMKQAEDGAAEFLKQSGLDTSADQR